MFGLPVITITFRRMASRNNPKYSEYILLMGLKHSIREGKRMREPLAWQCAPERAMAICTVSGRSD